MIAKAARNAEPTSRRSLLVAGAAVALAGAGVAIHQLVPWRGWLASRRIAEFSYDAAAGKGRKGMLLLPASLEESAAPRPLLVLIDPEGDFRGILRRYAVAAERRGWMLAASTHLSALSSNDAYADECASIAAHLQQRFPIDKGRVRVAGFGDGASKAYRLALTQPRAFSGAIVECGANDAWKEIGRNAGEKQSFFLFTREYDFNAPATRALRDAMIRAGFRTTYVERAGAHAPMTSAELDFALTWIDQA